MDFTPYAHGLQKSIGSSANAQDRKRSRLNLSSSSSKKSNSTKDHSLSVELEELRVLNEELFEKNRLQNEELEQSQERFTRQLEYVESENKRLRDSITEKTETYYEDKKNWRAQILEMEIQLEKSNENVTANNAPSSSSISSDNDLSKAAIDIEAQSKVWNAKLRNLEEKLNIKIKELHECRIEMANLKGTCKTQETQLLSTKSLTDTTESQTELRNLQQRCDEVTSQLRKKTRDLERTDKKLQNQIDLEEQIQSLQSKLKFKDNALADAASVESKYQVLLNEKKDWNRQLKGYINTSKCNNSNKHSTSDSGSNSNEEQIEEVTPAAVLRILRQAQTESAILLDTKSTTEAEQNNLKNQLDAYEKKVKSLSSLHDEAVGSKDSLESALRLQKQQSSLYEGEIRSLRTLIKSYEVELSMGKPKREHILQAKDKALTELQGVLDDSRGHAASLVAQISKLKDSNTARNTITDTKKNTNTNTLSTKEEDIRTTDKESESYQRLQQESAQLQSELKTVKDELIGLQRATGMDFVPGEVRVLHLVHNPSSHSFQSEVAPTNAVTDSTSSENKRKSAYITPIEELRRLREDNRRLRDMVIQRTNDGDTASSSNNAHTPATGTQTPAVATSTTPASASTGIDSSKLNLRLKEMFRERINCFREAVYLLTGYKIDLFSAGPVGSGATSTNADTANTSRLRLRSMYAEDPDDSIVFQWKGEALELIETPFVDRLDPRLLSILRGTNSIPAFLSNTTLELFEKQTFL